MGLEPAIITGGSRDAWRLLLADLPARQRRRAVLHNRDLPTGAVDRDAYVLCVLMRLHRALRRRDVYAVPSLRWADPRAQLLDGADWLAVRDEVLAGLGLAEPVERHLHQLTGTLDAAWRLLTRRLAEAGPDASVRIVPAGADGRVKLAVDRLEAVGESPSLAQLRQTVSAMLPRIDLPDLLLEVHGWTGFLHEYTHVGDLGSRMDDLPISVAALLVAEACNIGLTPVANPNVPALSRGRLSHVDQNYPRVDTHTAANARLIDTHAGIGIAQLWGDGLVASVDGLRFVVPVQTINAAPSPRYFGLKRGVAWLNAINDQVAGIGAVVVPGTMRDSLHILDTLLNLDAGPKPDMSPPTPPPTPTSCSGCSGCSGTGSHQRSRTSRTSDSGAPPRPQPRKAVVLWNTRYTDAAVTALRTVGHPVADEDAARLSPLGHAHINMLGRYAFTPPASTDLRPLRDPDGSDDM